MPNDAAQLTEIYTLLNRSAMNKEYYGAVLHRTQRLNDTLEILIAIGATSSGISGFTIFSIEPYGRIIWGSIAGLSALFAIAKPIIQLNKRIERLTRLYVGHSDNYAQLLIVVSRIRRRGEVTADLVSQFETAEARFTDLSKDDDPSPNLKLLRRCEQMVRDRHPAASAWYPEPTVDVIAAPSGSAEVKSEITLGRSSP